MTYLNIIETVHSKSTASIKLNGEKLSHSTNIKSKTRMSSPYLFNIVLEVLATVERQLKEIKGIQIETEEIKVSLFTDGMII